jgi:hypothetical protein
MTIPDSKDIQRNELKYRINLADYEVLRARLQTVMEVDPHAAPNPWYTVRSLYFDNADNEVLHSKMNGERQRSLYRIRTYNGGTSPIFLECKSRSGNLVSKRRQRISTEECSRAVASGFRRKPDGGGEWTLVELFSRETGFSLLKPVSLIEYRREAFVHRCLDVRVTFDTRLAAAPGSRPFLGEQTGFRRLFPNDVVILEIKFRRFLPDFIAGLLIQPNRPRIAISKYALCRACGAA